ncbi:MAG TPA: hypothetical protein VGI70_12100, partial [Polyangiales bacterium]
MSAARVLTVRSIFLSLSLAVSVWLPARTRADAQNGQVIPLGERQAYLGNSGTGDASDTGAVYFNPGSLGYVDRDEVSVTGSVYMSYSTSADAAFNLDDTNVPYKAKGFVTIPMTFVIAKKWHDLHLAFSTLVPDTLITENRQSFTTPNTAGNILQYYRESELWVGLTAAYPISDRLSVGLSLYGIQHSQSSLVNLVVDFPADPSSFVTAATRAQTSTFGLSAILGVAYKPTSELALGLRVQTPIAQLTGSADTYVADRSTGDPAMNEDMKGAKAKYQSPLDATLGASIKVMPGWESLVDVGLRFGTNYDTIPGSSLSDHIDTKATFRFSLGEEFKPTSAIPIRIGFLCNPSGVRSKSDEIRQNFFGFTAGVAYLTEHVETGVGGFYIWANGSQRSSDTGESTNVSATAVGA